MSRQRTRTPRARSEQDASRTPTSLPQMVELMRALREYEEAVIISEGDQHVELDEIVDVLLEALLQGEAQAAAARLKAKARSANAVPPGRRHAPRRPQARRLKGV